MKPTISSASGPSRTPAPNQPQPLRFLLDAIIAAPTPHNSQTNTPRNMPDNARLLFADQLFEPVPHPAPTALQLHAVLSVIFHGRTASISEPHRTTYDPPRQSAQRCRITIAKCRPANNVGADNANQTYYFPAAISAFLLIPQKRHVRTSLQKHRRCPVEGRRMHQRT